MGESFQRRIEESSNIGQTSETTVEGRGTTMKEVKIDGKTNKSKVDENSNHHIKFKKDEMLLLSSMDIDSWLFRLIN